MGHLPIDPPGSWSALDDIVTRVVETRSAIARLLAEESTILAEAGDLVLTREAERHAQRRSSGHDLALREVTSELGAAMRLSDRTVQQRMSAAASLTANFPQTLAAFKAGTLDAAHVSAIVDAGVSISSVDARTQYEVLLLEAAEFETPPRLRAIARVVAARLDSDTVEALQKRAHADRRVRVIALEDGMARLLVDLPAPLAYAIHDRLTQMAHEIITTDTAAELSGTEAKPSDTETDPSGTARADDTSVDADASARDAAADNGTGDVGEKGAGPGCRKTILTGPTEGEHRRSMDQVRSDVLTDLLLTGAPTAHDDSDALGSIRAHVQITIPALTLSGACNDPALLAGYGPIERKIAIALAAGAPSFDRFIWHNHTGAVLAVDRYRPTAELSRFLRVRDERCRFPGCTQKPWRCDIDHTIAHSEGGPTSECNLAHLCRRHHTVKHATDWTVLQLGNGILQWTSPTGRKYLDKPPTLVQFVPSRGSVPEVPGSEDPPPF